MTQLASFPGSFFPLLVCSPLATYNSLTDVHLVEYFSSPRRLRHLRRMGLVSEREKHKSVSYHCS